MNCTICQDILVDTAYSRCEWCRFGAPMERALEDPPICGFVKLGEAMGSVIRETLDTQGALRGILPVKQADFTRYTLDFDSKDRSSAMRVIHFRRFSEHDRYRRGWDAVFRGKEEV